MEKKKKVRYTKKLHAYRLSRMLDSSRKLMASCPAAPKFNVKDSFTAPHHLYNSSKKQVCGMCREFVAVGRDEGCPCLILGKSKALERSEKALKAFYLEEVRKANG